MRPTIDQLPEVSGRYTITISRFNEPPFTKEVVYDYEKGRWLEEEGEYTLNHIGSSDEVIHEAEWHKIHSFKHNLTGTQSTEKEPKTTI